jgi:hypothetical protein
MKVLWIILAYIAGTGLSTLFIWMAADWIFGVRRFLDDMKDDCFGGVYVTAVVLLCMLMTLPCVVAGGVITWLLMT